MHAQVREQERDRQTDIGVGEALIGCLSYTLLIGA